MDDIILPSTSTAVVTSTSTPAPGTMNINASVFIPIVAVIAGLFFAGVITVFRRQIYNFFRPVFGLPALPARPGLSDAESGQSRPNNISAEQLAGTAPRGQATTRGGRSRRGIRRTDSGQSVRTLPVYSKEAGDEELVLVRRQSMGSVNEEGDEGEGGMQTEMRERRTSGLSGVIERVGTLRRAASIRSITSIISRRSLRAQPDISTTTGTTEPIPELPGNFSTPQFAPTLESRPVSDSNTVRRGWGEAPSYLEAMSSPTPPIDDLPTDLHVPHNPSPRPTIRERTSSTFRGLLTRTGLVPSSSTSSSYSDPYNTGRTRNPPLDNGRRPTSSVSLLLQPQTSRLSTRSNDPTTSAYPSPWTSTHSLGIISPPVLHSAVRASFDSNDLPRAGLSDDQARFLGTKEATTLAGVRVGEVPAGRRRSGAVPTPRNISDGSGSSTDDIADRGGGDPPTWQELDGERRRAEAENGRGRACTLLAGDVELGRVGPNNTVSSASGVGSTTSTSISDISAVTADSLHPPSANHIDTSSSASTSFSSVYATPPPPPPRLDIVAPTPTSPTFPPHSSGLPVIPGSILGV